MHIDYATVFSIALLGGNVNFLTEGFGNYFHPQNTILILALLCPSSAALRKQSIIIRIFLYPDTLLVLQNKYTQNKTIQTKKQAAS